MSLTVTCPHCDAELEIRVRDLPPAGSDVTPEERLFMALHSIALGDLEAIPANLHVTVRPIDQVRAEFADAVVLADGELSVNEAGFLFLSGPDGETIAAIDLETGERLL